MNKISKLFLSAVMVSSLAACGQKETEGVSGEFSGTAKGMGGDVTVTVTLKDSVITDVKVQGDNETEGIGTKAIEKMPDEMVKANSINVDGVATATITSDAIKSAAEEAIKAAGLDPNNY